MKKIDTILFDLDGTLLDTLEDLADSVNYVMERFGYPEMALEDVRNYVGNGVERLMELSLPKGRANPQFDSCVLMFKERYKEHMQDKTKPYEDILALLQQLQGKYNMAVVSNKFDKAVKGLVNDYFFPYITVALGEASGIRKKPAPDMVFKALEELGAHIEGAVYVGDSEVDVKTALNAGLKCVGVTWGFRDVKTLKDTGAHYIIDKPLELLSLLNESALYD